MLVNADIFIEHASRYYDPVKAHEYYMRTRELKGRRSTRGMTERQRQGWDYAKNEIKEDRKSEIEDLRLEQKKTIEGLRGKATETRQQITAKLKQWREKLSDDVQQKIDALPPIPKGLPKEARARKAAERKEEIAKIRNDAKSERTKNQENASEQRTQVSTALKGKIQSVRDSYKQARDEIIAKFEEISDQEFINIKTTVR